MPRMTYKQMADAYWRIVRRCLFELFKMEKPLAARKCRKMRKAMESIGKGSSAKYFYLHEEMYYMACSIAGKNNKNPPKKYFEIRDEYFEIRDGEK